MKCSSIKLANRTIMDRRQFIEKNGQRCHPAILDNSSLVRSPVIEKKSENYQQPHLSVLNIIWPKDLKAFNTGSSIQRWANKRPRLKSAKQQGKEENSSEQELESPNQMEEHQREEIFLEVKEEVDEDVQRLIEESTKRETSEEDVATIDSKRISLESEEKFHRRARRKHRRKSKNKNKDKEDKSQKKLSKTVSFSLSKPPTPQTEQIIRVEVISNYSIEFQEENDTASCGDSRHSIENGEKDMKIEGTLLLTAPQFFQHIGSGNFCIESKKIMLFNRQNGEK